MKNIFLHACILLTQTVYTQWWNKHFIIGTQFDPSASNTTDVVTKYKQAMDADINLFTGELMAHSNNNPYFVYNNYFQNFKDSPDRPFCFSSRNSSFNSEYDGKFVWDEPILNQLGTVSAAINRIQDRTDKLGFVNLLPSYSGVFNKWDDYTKYIQQYSNPSNIKLNVLCFDNYYPDSNFPGYNSQGEYRRYYSNLSEMRKSAGDRPLWSYILTSGRLLNYDTDYQRAYLRLSAFAPMAYGAKGIIYYHYDRRDPYVVIRDLDYRKSPGWDNAVYYTMADNISEYEVLFGNFNTNANTHPHADIGIKTDECKGKWYMKYTVDASQLDDRKWDFENESYGTKDGTCPFITAWDDHLDHLGTIRNDGKMLLATKNKKWTVSASLAGISPANFKQLSRKRIAGGLIRGNIQPDLAVGLANTIFLYSDYTLQKGFSSKLNFTGFNHLQQLQTIRYTNAGDVLFAVCMAPDANKGILYTYSASTNRWTQKNIIISANGAGKPDHFWLEQYPDRLELHMQDIKNKLFYGKVTQNYIDINQFNATNTVSIYKSYGVKNGAGSYDLYCIPERSYIHDGLMDAYQKPTLRFGLVKTINRYLKDYVAPVVMNYLWQGCYHHNNTLGEESDSHYDVVDTGKPIKALSDSLLMAGVFSANENVSKYKFLIVVNKGYYTIEHASVTINGNYSDATIKPRIDTSSTTCTSTYDISSHTTTVTWHNMTAGECVVINLTP